MLKDWIVVLLPCPVPIQRAQAFVEPASFLVKTGFEVAEWPKLLAQVVRPPRAQPDLDSLDGGQHVEPKRPVELVESDDVLKCGARLEAVVCVPGDFEGVPVGAEPGVVYPTKERPRCRFVGDLEATELELVDLLLDG